MMEEEGEEKDGEGVQRRREGLLTKAVQNGWRKSCMTVVNSVDFRSSSCDRTYTHKPSLLIYCTYVVAVNNTKLV